LKTSNETSKKAGFAETTPHFGRLQPAQQPTAKQIKNSFKKSSGTRIFCINIPLSVKCALRCYARLKKEWTSKLLWIAKPKQLTLTVSIA
jgi:hypothetical protein